MDVLLDGFSERSQDDVKPDKPRSRYYLQKIRANQSSAVPSGSQSQKTISTAADPSKCGPLLPFGSDVVEGNHSSSVADPLDESFVTEPQLNHEGLDVFPSLSTTEERASVAVGAQPELPFPLHMDVIEPEKLAWMRDLPAPAKPHEKLLEGKNDLPEARFDTSGTILSPDSKIPVSAGLHHHGEQPEKAGYTLDEIIILMQSSVQAQKLWALTTLTAILKKAKMSMYDEYLQDSLLKKIVEDDLVLPLRFLLDVDSFPVITAAILALSALLVNEADEFMTDEVLIWDKAPVIHELAPENKPENEDKEEKDMTDSQLMRFDVVKGLLRTSLLRRLDYLLRTYGALMDAAVLGSLIGIISRIVRHSSEVALIVTKDASLISALTSKTVMSTAPLAQMRFLRICCCMLGPVLEDWTDRIYQSTAGWIANLRADIQDIKSRDMVIESLNLLIVLGNYGIIPRSVQSIADVFPQVLYSASPKLGTKVTVWDAKCCSRILSFLSLTTPLQVGDSGIFPDVLAVKAAQNVVAGFMQLYVDAEREEPNDHLIQLRASYLQYLCEYIRQRKPDYTSIASMLVAKLSESLPVTLDLSRIVRRKSQRMSATDPDSLRSFGLVAHGGHAIHRLFYEAARLNLMTHTVRCLRTVLVHSKMVPSVTKVLNRQMQHIPAYDQHNHDFWSYFFVRPMIEIVLFSLEVSVENGINPRYLYVAGLHMVPFLRQNDEVELRQILTKVVFNVDLYRRITWKDPDTDLWLEIASCFMDPEMEGVSQVFENLRPLGLEKSCLMASRDAGVFTQSWMFECYSYICSWAKASTKLRGGGVEHYVTGYFSWLAVMIRAISESLYRTVSPSKIYLALLDHFTGTDEVYRSEYPGKCLRAILGLITANVGMSFTLDPIEKLQGKPFDDVYNTLLDDYIASSYGDLSFTIYVLIPICQKMDPVYRKKFWGPEKQVWSVVRIHHLDLCYPVELHLEPAETSTVLLSQYFRLLANNALSADKRPLMNLLAIHHLNRFLRSVDSDEADAKFRGRFLKYISENMQTDMVQQILRYKGPATDRSTSIDVFKDTPESLKNIVCPAM